VFSLWSVLRRLASYGIPFQRHTERRPSVLGNLNGGWQPVPSRLF
jgi:hypothetical protein